MRILLDEMLPVGVADLLPDHEVVTAKAAGYAGLTNGELIRRAVAHRFEVLLTADRNLPAQQRLDVSGIALVLVRGSRMAELQEQAGDLRAAIARARSGEVLRIERHD